MTTVTKHFTTSIPLWVRDDQPRQTGLDYWKGPHSKIITATPGLREYRQIEFADRNPGLWPETSGVETGIPADRKMDGIAEVTFKSPLSPLLGRSQTQLAYRDEVNVFRRTFLYSGLPRSSRWYQVGNAKVGSRALIYLRRRQGVGAREFRSTLSSAVTSRLAGHSELTELRTQSFLPWSRLLWNTPNVAHDNPVDQQFHASVILGFVDRGARDDFFWGPMVRDLSVRLASVAFAVHAYDIAEARTYVKDGRVLGGYER